MLAVPLPPEINNYAYGSFTRSGPVTALGSALKAWWDADDHGTARMTDDGAGLISSWTDKVAALAYTGATTARPTWTSTALQSPMAAKAGLTFDGVANVLSGATTGLPVGSTAGEIYVLVSQNDPTSHVTVNNAFGYGSITNSTGRVIARTISGVNRVYINDQLATLIDTQANFLGVHVVSGNWAGTTQAGRIDGVPFNPASGAIATLNTSTTNGRIGSRPNSSTQFWLGVIRHIMVTTTLTALQRQQLEAWLLWDVGWHRYRLPSTHPFRDRRP